MATVFIGIPTINRPDYVQVAIRSVLEQTFSDIEVVVSDNGSEPGVAESIVAFIAGLNDSRISFYQQQSNIGEYGQGRFFFSRAASSTYFMILHDDDLLCANYLETAIRCLEKSPDCAFFVSDAYTIDEHGDRSADVTRWFLKSHGRKRAVQGEIDVLEKHLGWGFTLITGTLFRTEKLLASGFVGPEGVGNYPFESELFLRLGDLGARAWYQQEELLAIRFHSGSIRHYIHLLENRKTVNAMLRLFECRQYTGFAERRRRANLCRLYRALAMIEVREGKFDECRKYLRKCFACKIFSPKLWLIAPFAFIAPRILCRFLPALPVIRETPLLRDKTLREQH